MAIIDGLTEARMLEIEAASVVDGDVVGDNLILKRHDETTINAGNVRGPAGYGADSDAATATWINSGPQTRDALANLLTPKARGLGLYPNCVIVGSSNATSGTWDTTFCTAWGLTKRNYAIGGSAFTGSNNFLTQLQTAAADSAFANSNVSLVIICDASNNARAWNDAGATYDITSDAITAFTYAKNTFPNARIVCVPLIWPADCTIVNTTPYQKAWHKSAIFTSNQLRTAAQKVGIEFVEGSWTWLTSIAGVMTGTEVHPNAAGYTLCAEWISKHIRGEDTVRGNTWENCKTDWTSPGTQPSIVNGSFISQFFINGVIVNYRLYLTFGPNTTGGSGAYSFKTPFKNEGGILVSGNGVCYSQTAGLYSITAFILSGADTLSLNTPLSASSNVLNPIQNADGSGTAGTGVPRIAGNYTFQSGSNFEAHIQYRFI